MDDYLEPYSWWGGSPVGTQPRSITQLILDGMLDCPLAGLLWSALARRASVLVTSAAPRTGKTTLLTALLDFLPPGTSRIFLRGWEETFDFVHAFSPETSYLLVNKLSPNLPTYFWGPKVVDLFDLLADGWRLGATVQGESVEAIARQLAGRDVGLDPAALTRIDLVVNLGTGIHGGRVWRCVLGLHVPEFAGARAVSGRQVASFGPGVATATIDDAGLGALAGRLGIDPADLAAEVARRSEFLERLVARQVVNGVAVRSELRRFVS